ncbi:hypothetical protein HAX54_006360 [Datura stramonium]|uniref:Uncharacterized protein n=1 Tax=Datura stramonium TaxID=4076 RepID=A0ABS8WWI1_DATST|nr:hypothetical protein [Datura stramonium]
MTTPTPTPRYEEGESEYQSKAKDNLNDNKDSADKESEEGSERPGFEARQQYLDLDFLRELQGGGEHIDAPAHVDLGSDILAAKAGVLTEDGQAVDHYGKESRNVNRTSVLPVPTIPLFGKELVEDEEIVDFWSPESSIV